jgi:hypothetical protein
MTAEEKERLLTNIMSMGDSPVEAEAVAAFLKYRALREKMGWPSFGDVMRADETAANKIKEAEQNREKWEQAHAARVAENAALARRNAALAVRIAALRSALWVMLNWRMIAGAVVVVVAGFGGWRVWNAQAAPDKAPLGEAENAAFNTVFADVLSRAKWSAGDAVPVTVRIAGSDWWIVVRGSVDADSHADARGHPIERHCLQLYAHEAVRDAGAFLAPSPYFAFGQWMKWPMRAAECRMPGKANYS